MPVSRLAARGLWALLVLACILAGGCSRDEGAVESRLTQAGRLLREGKVRQARVSIDAAIDADPSRRETYLSAMAVFAAAQRHADAAIVGEQMLKQAELKKLDSRFNDEDWAQSYVAVGDMHWRARNIPSAESLYKKALALAPDSPQLLNQLGYLYADEGIHLEEALKLTRRAADLAPDSGAIVDSYGWAQYKLGRYEPAVRTLRRAVELSPDEPDLRYHLGAAYLKAGRRLDAQVELRKALHLDPHLREASVLLKTTQKSPARGRSN